MTTARRRRTWEQTTTNLTMTVLGQPGQKATSLNLPVGSPAGLTVAMTHICSLITFTGTDVAVVRGAVAIGNFGSGMDSGDFPSVLGYDGSFLAMECFVVKGSGTAGAPGVPESASFFRTSYRSQRKMRDGDAMWLIAEIDTSISVVVTSVVSQLWLLP